MLNKLTSCHSRSPFPHVPHVTFTSKQINVNFHPYFNPKVKSQNYYSPTGNIATTKSTKNYNPTEIKLSKSACEFRFKSRLVGFRLSFECQFKYNTRINYTVAFAFFVVSLSVFTITTNASDFCNEFLFGDSLFIRGLPEKGIIIRKKK